MEKKSDERSEILRRLGPYLSLGTMFAASLLLGIGAGYWLDGRFGTSPWLTLTGLILGLALGVYNFIVVVVQNRPR